MKSLLIAIVLFSSFSCFAESCIGLINKNTALGYTGAGKCCVGVTDAECVKYVEADTALGYCESAKACKETTLACIKEVHDNTAYGYKDSGKICRGEK